MLHGLRGERLELFDLLDEVGLLVVELLVFGPVRVKFGQEVDQLVLIKNCFQGKNAKINL